MATAREGRGLLTEPRVMNGYEDQIRQIVEEWPDEGYVVGVLPDPADPEWSGRAVLDLIEAADRSGGPSVIVDLAPDATDLATRFEAGRGPGLAELAADEAELWEVTHRSDRHRAVYLGEGAAESASDLAGSGATADLAEQMSDRGRLLLVVLNRAGAKAAASAGYVDGLVRIGEADGDVDVEGMEELGRVTARPGETRPVPEGEGGPRLVLPPEMRSEHRRKERMRRILVGVAALIAVGLLASSLLGGPDLGDLLSGSDGTPAAVDRVDRGEERTAAAEAAASDSPSAVQSGPTDSATEPPVQVGASEAATDDTAPGTTAESGASGAGEGGAPGAAAGEVGGLASELVTADSAASPGVDPESGGPPEFRAVADSLALSIQEFVRRAGQFRGGEIGCGELIEARRRADRLFERLWLERMSLQPAPDSPAAATFRERSRQMETVEQAYEATSCPAGAFEGA